MIDFNWQKTLYSLHGDAVTCEELYQLFVARMKSESLFKGPVPEIVDAGFGITNEALQIFMAEDASGLSRAELRADGGSGHADSCKSPFGVCTCSGGNRNWQHAPSCKVHIRQGLCTCSAVKDR